MAPFIMQVFIPSHLWNVGLSSFKRLLGTCCPSIHQRPLSFSPADTLSNAMKAPAQGSGLATSNPLTSASPLLAPRGGGAFLPGAWARCGTSHMRIHTNAPAANGPHPGGRQRAARSTWLSVCRHRHAPASTQIPSPEVHLCAPGVRAVMDITWVSVALWQLPGNCSLHFRPGSACRGLFRQRVRFKVPGLSCLSLFRSLNYCPPAPSLRALTV